MKKGFVRCLWGKPGTPMTYGSMSKDMEFSLAMTKRFPHPFTTYVYGEDNYRLLHEKGLDVVLAGDNPNPWPEPQHFLRPKIDLIRYAMEEGKHDEIVFLDWDCYPVADLPVDFWERLGERGAMQMCLIDYRSKRCTWRERGARTKMGNSGWLYLRGKDLPRRAVRVWEGLSDHMKFNDEYSWAMVQDDLMGGWQGTEFYFEHFESMFSHVREMGKLWSNSQMSRKNVVFFHEWNFRK